LPDVSRLNLWWPPPAFLLQADHEVRPATGIPFGFESRAYSITQADEAARRQMPAFANQLIENDFRESHQLILTL
jgi:hypothetical protein